MSSVYDDIKCVFEEMKFDGSKIIKNVVVMRVKRNIVNLFKEEEKWVKLWENIEKV